MTDSKTTPYANSVFEQPWWLNTVAEGKWGEAVVKDGERVIARLPYVFEHGGIKNPPYTQTLGIWMADDQRAFERGNAQFHRQKAIIAELIKQLPKAKGIHFILDHTNSYILPFRWHGFRIEPTFSYRIRNVQEMESVKSKIGKTVNKNIRAAQRGLYVDDSSNDYQALIELQKMTYARQNRRPPHGDDLTLKIIQAAMAQNAGKLLIARDSKGIAHSAAFFLYDEKACYYLLGGQNPTFKSDGSQNLLLMNGIEFSSKVSKSFDFEGSMVEGIENFFRQFGGEQIVNYSVIKQSIYKDFIDALKPRIKKAIGYKI